MTTATLTPPKKKPGAIFQVSPVDNNERDTQFTEENRSAYKEAMKDYANGVNTTRIDFSKVKTLADFDKLLDD